MGIPSGAFPGATSGTTPAIYPVGSSGNQLQATGFIPEIWSGKLVEKFYASTVLAAISNTDYEGEIKNKGDRVKIRTKPTITIRNYDSDGLLALDRPTGGTVELYIGNGKYFSLVLDDVMEVQSDLNILSMWSDDAAQQLKIAVDSGRAPRHRRSDGGCQSGHRRGRDHCLVEPRRSGLVPVGRGPQRRRRSGRTPRRSDADGPGARRAEHPGSRPLDRDAGLGWPHDQTVGTPPGLLVWRQRVDAAKRPPRHGGPFHPVREQLAPEQQQRLDAVQLRRVADFRGPRAWADLCVANLKVETLRSS
jgi:hypothetical protein